MLKTLYNFARKKFLEKSFRQKIKKLPVECFDLCGWIGKTGNDFKNLVSMFDRAYLQDIQDLTKALLLDETLL